MINNNAASMNSGEILKKVLESIPVAIFQICVDSNYNIRLNYINDRWLDIFDYPAGCIDNFDEVFRARIYTDDIEEFTCSLINAVQSSTTWTFECRFIKHGGERLWLYGRAEPERHGDSTSTVYNGFLFDTTKRKVFEEKLRQYEDKFYKIFIASPDCIAITRMSDGMIIDVNKGFEKITGWTRDEVIGKTSLQIKFWEDYSERNYMHSQLIAGNDIIDREVHFRRIDGSIRIGKYTVRSVIIPEGLCLIYILQDITENIKLEYRQKKLEQQFLSSQKMEAIGRLANGIAHDFNNILATILGNTSLILMKYESDHPDYIRLKRIEESVKRGAYLTKQLLGFARGGKYSLKKISVNNVLKNSVDFFIETRKDIEAKLELMEDIYPVEADINQIEQVFLNLFINAADAMTKGGNLYVKTSNSIISEDDTENEELSPGKYVKISISDNGTGMDSNTIGKIFEPFFTTKGNSGGTGLGLASVYGIVHNHSGIVKVESELGYGSTFIIYLPACMENDCEETADKKNKVQLIPGSGSILIIDDEPSILESSSGIIKMLGYKVYTATSGHEAISIYIKYKNEIDVVIVDMIMPGLKGDSVIKILKEINADIKVILASGYGVQEEMQEILKSSCNWFLHKPYTTEEISKAINSVLNISDKQ